MSDQARICAILDKLLWDLEPNSYPEIDSSSDNIVTY